MTSELNLPKYNLRYDEKRIYDIIRKKWVSLTPEEWVRQNFMMYLIDQKKYPKSLIRIEETISAFNKTKRCDAVVYSNEVKPIVIIECKNPSKKIDTKTFHQVAVYNSAVKAPILIITNGLEHFCCKINFETQQPEFLDNIPDYSKLASF